MISKILLLPAERNSADRVKLSKMVEFFGLEQLDQPPDSSEYAVIISGKNLDLLSGMRPPRAVLVYDCREDIGTLRTAIAKSNLYRVGSARVITRQLSGLTISGPSCCDGAHVFPGALDSDILISLGEMPFFIRQARGGCDWFYLGGNGIIDLDYPIENEKFNIDAVFPQLLPFYMFFQYICQKTSRPVANLTIDDPALQRRYGFIDYGEVANLVRKENFAVTIAFIPWNHKRSNRETVDLFAANSDRLSICVHGCDHEDCEFGSAEPGLLDWKCRLAKERMQSHHARFGLPYDNVMVFPQGVFSRESMRFLQACGITATVNSHLRAHNCSDDFKIRDLLTPATTRYGLPLFLRRYPDRIEDFAYDLFFGRPALIVQHNADFANGWENILSFIRRLNTIEPDLQWMPLGKVVENHLPPAGSPLQSQFDASGENGGCGYTMKSYLKTALRRYACDVRDNYLCRSGILRNFFYRN